VAEQIGRDEREVPGKPGRHRLPGHGRIGDSVQQQEHGTLPGTAIAHALPVQRQLVGLEDLAPLLGDDPD
jgi:hypothetical protein